MTRLLALLRRLVQSPDGYHGDPEGWVGNQAAHALVVGGLLLLGSLWLGQWAAVAVAVLYAAVEAVQIRFYGSKLWDSLSDWSFVVCGALLVQAGWHGDATIFRLILVNLLAAAALGVWRRA